MIFKCCWIPKYQKSRLFSFFSKKSIFFSVTVHRKQKNEYQSIKENKKFKLLLSNNCYENENEVKIPDTNLGMTGFSEI